MKREYMSSRVLDHHHKKEKVETMPVVLIHVPTVDIQRSVSNTYPCTKTISTINK